MARNGASLAEMVARIKRSQLTEAFRGASYSLNTGGGEPVPEPPEFGDLGPEAPTISGLTLAWDFDLGYEPMGAMRAEIPSRAGSDTDAIMHPMTGGLQVVNVAGTPTRRALRFDAAVSSFARILDGLTTFNEANCDYTLVAICHRQAAGAAHTVWHLHAGYPSGTDSEIVITHRLQITSADSVQFFRNGASGTSGTSPNLGTVAMGRVAVVTRSNLTSDTIGRSRLNSGTKTSTTVRSITQNPWSQFIVGAQEIWRGGTSGFPEYIKHGAIDLERIVLYAGAATDANIDTLNAWHAAGYP